MATRKQLSRPSALAQATYEAQQKFGGPVVDLYALAGTDRRGWTNPLWRGLPKNHWDMQQFGLDLALTLLSAGPSETLAGGLVPRQQCVVEHGKMIIQQMIRNGASWNGAIDTFLDTVLRFADVGATNGSVSSYRDAMTAQLADERCRFREQTKQIKADGHNTTTGKRGKPAKKGRA